MNIDLNKIIYRENHKIDNKELLELYLSVGWTNYTNKPEMLYNAYQNSLYTYSAYYNDKLIGVIRVVGDAYSIIYIQDIIVKPDYQRERIGTNLLTHVIQKYENVYQIILLTLDDEKTVKFYRSLGFKRDSDLGCVAFCQFH